MDNRQPDKSSSKKFLTHMSSMRMPKHLPRETDADDKPDLPANYLKELEILWFIDSKSDEKPIARFLNAWRQHVDVIYPYFEDCEQFHQDWYERMNKIYQVMKEMEDSVMLAKDRRFYSIPHFLEQKEINARLALSQNDAQYLAATRHYPEEIDRRQAEILETERIIKLIESTADKEVIAKIKRPALPNNEKPVKVTGLSSLFSRKSKREAPTRDELLAEYKQNLAHQMRSLEIFRNDAPAKPTKYSEEYLEALADIKFHWLDFYSCQTKEVMLQCVRAYVLAYTTYYQVYLEYPNEEDRDIIHLHDRRIQQIQDDQMLSEDERFARKAKACFKQMLEGMKSNLLLFYCQQPDRRDFIRYLDNFKKIPDNKVRAAIIAGNDDPTIIDKVFPNFQTQMDAFGANRMTR